MRSAGIDARWRTRGEIATALTCYLQILPTHADHSKAIVRPIVRPLAVGVVGRHTPGEIIGRGGDIFGGSHKRSVMRKVLYNRYRHYA